MLLSPVTKTPVIPMTLPDGPKTPRFVQLIQWISDPLTKTLGTSLALLGRL